MAKKGHISKVTRAGQVTIPKGFRHGLNLKEGDYVEIIETGEGILIRPIETVQRRLTMHELVEKTEEQIAKGQFTRIKPDEIEDFLDDL